MDRAHYEDIERWRTLYSDLAMDYAKLVDKSNKLQRKINRLEQENWNLKKQKGILK